MQLKIPVYPKQCSGNKGKVSDQMVELILKKILQWLDTIVMERRLLPRDVI
ncbi:hypothetical protein MOOTH_26230 [Moorella thermoacetica]|nr:hypothetical protein MOOTH_26230 [Moorella thermoacetica]